MSYGEIRGVQTFENPTAFSARDEFNQSAGALTGKTAPVGGTWAGAGDATDFAVEATGHTAQRTAVSDAASTVGRFAVSGAAATTNQAVEVAAKASAFPATGEMGVLARYVDTSNWFAATLDPGTSDIHVTVMVAASASTTSIPMQRPMDVGTYRTVRLLVFANGTWFLFVDGVLARSGSNSALATGGALASGKPGVYDAWQTSTASTRNYDNFLAFVPTADAAIFASQSLEIRHDRVIREDSAGAVWTPVTSVRGDYLRWPPGGLEGRPTRFIVKASRNDPDTGTDPGIDNISVRAYVRPSWLIVPGS